MDLDFELYRRDVVVSAQPKVRLSVIDIKPERPLYTLVMIHGYGGNAMQWKYQLRAFGDSCRCIAPDLRGHGRSDAPASQYDIDEMMADLEALLDGLAVDGPVVLIGHSFGGALATTFAHRTPERVERLILTASAARYDLAWYTRTLIRLPVPVLEALQPVYRSEISAPPLVIKRFANNALYKWNGRGMMRSLDLPVLVIRGDRDAVFPSSAYEEVAQIIPRAEEINVGGSKHMVILERRDAVERAIDRFLGLGHALWRSGDREAEERAQLLAERPWLKVYDEGVPFMVPVPNRPLPTLLESAARRFGRHPATIFAGKTLTYRQVERQANRLAHALRGLGVGAGTRVMLLMPNAPQWVIAFYGVLKAKGVVVGASPASTVEEIAREIADSGVDVVITLAGMADTVRAARAQSPVRQVIYTSLVDYAPEWVRRTRRKPLALQPGELEWRALLAAQPSSAPEADIDPDGPALIQYTGGTTAAPKGVILSHRALMANAFQTRHWMPGLAEGRERMLCVVPFAHAYGLTAGMNTSLAMGAAMIILPTFVTADVLRAVKRHKPTLFPGVPTMYVAINSFPGVRRFGIEEIKACISGAAPLPVEVQEKFEKLTKGRLVEGYGLTEASPVTHANPLHGKRKTGTIGVPLPNTEARIVHLQTGEDLAPGEIGELAVRGPQIMSGYWGDPERTQSVLRDGWLFTGDVARMDSEGYFQIISRKRDMWYPERTDGDPQPAFPRDVEEVIYEIPDVKEVAVVGVGGWPVAFVTARRELAAGTITGYCERRLPAELVPKLVVFVDEMPKSFVGKIIRRRLLDHLPEHARQELDITSDRIEGMLDYPYEDE